jgi:hypothetical protein
MRIRRLPCSPLRVGSAKARSGWMAQATLRYRVRRPCNRRSRGQRVCGLQLRDRLPSVPSGQSAAAGTRVPVNAAERRAYLQAQRHRDRLRRSARCPRDWATVGRPESSERCGDLFGWATRSSSRRDVHPAEFCASRVRGRSQRLPGSLHSEPLIVPHKWHEHKAALLSIGQSF